MLDMFDIYIIGLLATLKPFAEAINLIGPAGLFFAIIGIYMFPIVAERMRGQ